PLTTNHQPLTTNPSQWSLLWGVLAGLMLGEMALTRSDFIFYLVPVPFYLLYWWLSGTWRRAYTFFAGTLAAMLLFYALYFFFYSFPYTTDLYHNKIIDVRRLWGPVLLALYGGLALLGALRFMRSRLRPAWLRIERLATRGRLVWVGVLIMIIAAYSAYNYFIGPWLPNVRFDSAGHRLPQLVFTTWQSYTGAPVDLGSRYNLLRVGWYLSPVGLVLAVGGLLRWVWGRLNAATGLFMGALLVLSYVFIQETYTEATYIYSMRRYVPIILPALIMGFAWICHYLWSRVGARTRVLGSTSAGLLVVGLAVFFLYTSRTIIGHTEEAGAVKEFDALAKQFPKKSVVLFSDGRDEPYVVATPLQFIYGVESFVVTQDYPKLHNNILQGMAQRWMKSGYAVYVMMSTNGGKVSFPGLGLKQVGTWDYSVPEYEQQYYQKPSNVYQANLSWGIYSVTPGPATPASLPLHIEIGDGSDYQYLVAGLQAQERATGDASSWRWTADSAIVRVPWPSQATGLNAKQNPLNGGTVHLRLRPETPLAGSAPLRTQPLTVTLLLDDTPIGNVVVKPGTNFTDYTVKVPPGTPKAGTDVSGPGSALLTINSPTWSGRTAGISYDERVLGVQVDSIDIGP
ncbi:MAG: DUF2079 domain-containing protein, partial [Chloroflexota bacterium]|nr:DUF2079 domain-containing protein [Chloroflexota bacterium]